MSQQPQSALNIPVQDTQEPSEEGKRLVALFTEMEGKQLDFLDESGKSIIERVVTLLTVLIAVASFSNNFPPAYLKGNLPTKILVIVTLAFYLLAMGSAIWAIQPRYYRRYLYNVTRLGEELGKITRRKMFWLRIAGTLFALGTVALAILIIAIIWVA
ncbi:MAG TPA: hypothetical protein VL485_13750 [Ktedonobacteraceae bacterium]|jgi:hypothetical protein|nr:hypothetical protein [Ktedonobacteraceae bacterium]